MLCPRSPSVQDPVCPSPGPCVRQCLWPRARRRARPRSARRSDASRRQRGRCLAPLPSRALGSAPAAPREPGRTPPRPELLSPRLPPPNPNSTPPPRRAHPTPPGPLPSLLLLISALPSPGGLGSLPRKQPRLRFPEAPPLPPREYSDWPWELELSSSRLLPLHQRLGVKGRQGTRGPFLIGWRGQAGSTYSSGQKSLRER